MVSERSGVFTKNVIIITNMSDKEYQEISILVFSLLILGMIISYTLDICSWITMSVSQQESGSRRCLER